MRSILLCALLVVGCSDDTTPKARTSDGPKNAAVSGFVEFQGRRFDIVDGLIDFDTEPLEWEKYSIRCILSHDAFTDEQLTTIRNGSWLDMNHQSVPARFPMIRSATNDLPFSPGVSVSFGEWKVANPPNLEQMEINMRLSYFDAQSKHHTITLERAAFRILEIRRDPLTVEFATEGSSDDVEGKVRWKIDFLAQYYGDPWPLYRYYSGPYYTPPPNRSTEQGGTGQPATAPQLKSEGIDKPQLESEGRSR